MSKSATLPKDEEIILAYKKDAYQVYGIDIYQTMLKRIINGSYITETYFSESKGEEHKGTLQVQTMSPDCTMKDFYTWTELADGTHFDTVYEKSCENNGTNSEYSSSEKLDGTGSIKREYKKISSHEEVKSTKRYLNVDNHGNSFLSVNSHGYKIDGSSFTMVYDYQIEGESVTWDILTIMHHIAGKPTIEEDALWNIKKKDINFRWSYRENIEEEGFYGWTSSVECSSVDTAPEPWAELLCYLEENPELTGDLATNLYSLTE